MKLTLNYKGINKQMLNIASYDEIVKFVNERFFLKMSKWNMSYIDADGDAISLDSDLDVSTMMETCGKEEVKIYVKDNLAAGEIGDGEEKGKVEEAVVEPVKVEAKVEESQPEVEKVEQKEVQAMEQKQVPQETNEQGGQRCFGGRGAMWKKKIEQKMAKFVDERVQNLLPYIIKQVQDKLQNKKPEPAPVKTQSVNHKTKCNICGTDPIIGIRYKCTKCPLFNLCESCEAKTGHSHNLIKMRFIDEEENKEEKPRQLWKGGPWVTNPPPHGMFYPGPGGFSFPPPPGLMPPPPFQFSNPNSSGSVPPPPPPPPAFLFGPPPASSCPKKEKDQSCDPRFKITKKCFKMSQLFGGEPKEYQEFVTKNSDLKFEELSQLYITMNESAKISEEVNPKIVEKTKKLGFYFNKPSEKYLELVTKNPAANFKQLIEIVNKVPICQPKPEQKPLPIAPKLQQKPIDPQPAPIAPVAQPQKKKIFNIQKRNECVLEMKELFGDQNVFDYINFYNGCSELSNQKIIDLYLEKMTGKDTGK